MAGGSTWPCIVLATLWRATALRESQEELHQLLTPGDCPEFPEVEGYVQKCAKSCAGLSFQLRSEGLSNRVEECRAECDKKDSCSCFTFTQRGSCKLGFGGSRRLRPAGSGVVAYGKIALKSEDVVIQVKSSEELPVDCRKGHKAYVERACGPFYHCADGSWELQMCPYGFAFNPLHMKCEWFQAVPHCAASAEQPLIEVGCHRQQFLLASGMSDSTTQQGIKAAIEEWLLLVTHDIRVHKRADGKAALNILTVVKFEIATAARWAVFTRNEAGQLIMQAVALVAKDKGEINIMAVVSRRSLLKDSESVAGGGKALLAGILEIVSAEDPRRAVQIIGTPGDKFVEALYLKHGMQVIGQSENGMPLLSLDIPAKCTDFISRAVLCEQLRGSDYVKAAWRLAPFSGRIYQTCAHVMPSELYWEKISKFFPAILRHAV